MSHEMMKLLERYHDQEVSPEEAIRVEEMLTSQPEALDYLGALDEMAELARTAIDVDVAEVSFDGLWSRIETQIEATPTPVTQAAQVTPDSQGAWSKLSAWFGELFTEHKGAWVTAGATAAAVALVMAFFVDKPAERIIERQMVVVDSVDKIDPGSTVLVNHIEGSNTAIIWTLPQTEGNDQDPAEEDEEGIEIIEEPL